MGVLTPLPFLPRVRLVLITNLFPRAIVGPVMSATGKAIREAKCEVSHGPGGVKPANARTLELRIGGKTLVVISGDAFSDPHPGIGRILIAAGTLIEEDSISK